MKFKVTKSKKPSFEPIKIELELNTPNDLFYLAAALNLSDGTITEACSYLKHYGFKKTVGFSGLWNELDGLAEEWIAACRHAGVGVMNEKEKE